MRMKELDASSRAADALGLLMRLVSPALQAWRRGLGVSGLVLGLLAGPAGVAQAEPLSFNFALDFVSGPLSGQSAIGAFSVSSDDCAALVCTGIYVPSGPNATFPSAGKLLDFQIVVDGVSFNATSDDAYPDFPAVTLVDNVLTSIDFVDFGSPSLAIYGGPDSGGGSYVDANFDASLIGAIRQVPEPATALLLAGALLAGFSTSGRRRR